MDDRLKAVIDAWDDAGPVPDYHYVMKDWVRKNWPILGNALDNLTGPGKMPVITTSLPPLPEDTTDSKKQKMGFLPRRLS